MGNHRLENATPLFVVGAARSGTTITARILNAHRRILMTNETAVFLALDELIRKSRQGVRAGILYGKEYHELWADLLEGEAVRLVTEYYERIAEAEEKADLAYWGDKHPHYCHCLELIHHLFPSARYIYVIRDPRDVACSIAEMNGVSLESGLKSWSQFTRRFERFFESHPEVEVHSFRYEDLVADYAGTTVELLHWLGLEQDEAVKTYLAKRSDLDAHTIRSQKPRRRDFRQSVGRWRREFGEPERALARELAGPFLEEHGYRW